MKIIGLFTLTLFITAFGLTAEAANLAQGKYGGKGVSVVVGNSFGVHIMLNCARGEIPNVPVLRAAAPFKDPGYPLPRDPAPALAPSTYFIEEGTYTQGGGAYPIGGFKTRPAVYIGRVQGGVLTVRILLVDDPSLVSAGGFTALNGEVPQIFPCP